MSHQTALIVGQTPWSARVPLDPLFANGIKGMYAELADEGVGRGPGGPPHIQCRIPSLGK